VSETKTTRQPADAAGHAPARAGAAEQQQGRRKWHILAVVLVGSFMAVLDTTIVNVPLPSIAVGIHASSAELEWVVSGYALTFGLALVPAGRLGDQFGHRLTFIAGLGLFTLASVGCGLSQSPVQLIAARVIQGLGPASTRRSAPRSSARSPAGTAAGRSATWAAWSASPPRPGRC
jgi:MFS family permease